MRISLVHARFQEGNTILPPLGILSIGTVLRGRGHEVQVVDLDPLREDRTDEVVSFRPDLVGVSAMTTGYKGAERLLHGLDERLGDVPIGMGGVHATAMPERILSECPVDFVVVGEGERTMEEVCVRLEQGEALDGVAGVVLPSSDGPGRWTRRRLIADLDEIPHPDRGLIDFDWYLIPPGVIKGYYLPKSTSCMTSRGCPHRCIYCGSHEVFGRRVRRRSVTHVIDELDELVRRFGIKGIYFVDDVFTLKSRWVEEFCDTLGRMPWKLTWACVTRVDQVSEPLLRSMKQSGCIHVEFGVESGSEKVLERLRKGYTIPQIKEAFGAARRVGLRTFTSGILGTPDETMEDIEATRSLLDELRPDFTHFFFTVPFPGTELWDEAVERKWIDRDSPFHEGWDFRTAEVTPVFMGIDGERLREIRSRLQNRMLLRNYLHTNNLRFAMSLSWMILRYPREAVRSLRAALRTGRIDHLIERTLTHYRAVRRKPATR